MSQPSLFEDYFRLTSGMECSRILHRWVFSSMLGSLLGARCYVRYGNNKIYPNLYVMCVGSSGARKSSAIKLATRFLLKVGYQNIAADATTREQFFEDFANQIPSKIKDEIEVGLFDRFDEVTSLFSVIADEFAEFAGLNNVPFYSTLGNMWDYYGIFEYRPKNSKKIKIINPILNLLCGTTADSFNLAFPPQTLNQGLVSRFVIINAGKVRQKIAFPKPFDQELEGRLVEKLKRLNKLEGEIEFTTGAKKVFAAIYENWENIGDVRFISYGSRRHIQLLKLCIILCAASNSLILDQDIVMQANTILTYAETQMPEALGEHGLSKGSGAAERILSLLREAKEPMHVYEIFKAISQDVKDMAEFLSIMQTLHEAKKVTMHAGAKYTATHSNYRNTKNINLYCDLKTLWENEYKEFYPGIAK